MNRPFMLLVTLTGAFSLTPTPAAPAQSIVVASKQDAETAILAEMAAILIRQTGSQTRISHSLGGTPVVWKALLRGDVDIYPEYTGTIAQQILHDPSLITVEQFALRLGVTGHRAYWSTRLCEQLRPRDDISASQGTEYPHNFRPGFTPELTNGILERIFGTR